MLFTKKFTIPANTSQDSPHSEMMLIDFGILTEVEVQIPSGHARLAHLKILFHESQIVPENDEGSVVGDTNPVRFTEFREIDQPPYELKLIGWNDDDSYPHSFYLFITVLPPEAVSQVALSNYMKAMVAFLGVPISSEEVY